MKHAYTRQSNVNSKVQPNMHTSRNSQCNPDMQCSNIWTMETSHDCKSNTKSIIIIIKKKKKKGGSCLCEWIVIWKSQTKRWGCNVLLYGTFYGRLCNLCNGLMKMSCILYIVAYESSTPQPLCFLVNCLLCVYRRIGNNLPFNRKGEKRR